MIFKVCIGIVSASLAIRQVFAADFYAGKTIELTVGADAGGGYDIYARTLARHMSRYIPGHPTVVVRNMPGAGSGRAAGYIAAIAPKDGTAFAAIMPGAIMDPFHCEVCNAVDQNGLPREPGRGLIRWK